MLLSPEERARAARFRSPVHGQRFIAAHGRLRELLGAAVGSAPAALKFAARAHGKPCLAGEEAARGLEFNLSHSGDLALVGWCWWRNIGVDIECWRAVHDEAALVQRFFSPAENIAYESLPAPRRQRGFFECWSRKEAYVKAVGRGLGLPLDSFDVSFGDDGPARLLRHSSAVDGATTWSISAVDVPPRASAAVVLESETCELLPPAAY